MASPPPGAALFGEWVISHPFMPGESLEAHGANPDLNGVVSLITREFVRTALRLGDDQP